MRSLFDSEALTEVKHRLDKITEDTSPDWGKMNAGQMLKHCQTPFLIMNGTVEMKTKVGFFKKLIFSMMKPMMYNDKPWKKNVPTGKEFIINEDVDFDKEKGGLLDLVNEFHKRKDQKVWQPHPVFGKLTGEQYGKMNYKHLDHHLRQFGV